MNRDQLGALVSRYLGSKPAQRQPASAEQRAQGLIAAIDAGGVPLNPFIVNDIARQMGLTVTAEARMPDTIERIRKALGSR